MKVFDSGMPEESYWNSLFDLPTIVAWVDPSTEGCPLVEIGCGYGTFTVPVARACPGTVHAFDIEAAMIDRARANVESAGLPNVRFHQRDVLEEGTGLTDESVRTVLLFNLLHSRVNRSFLAEAARILVRGGSILVIHWRKDIPTPRGPRVEDRPDAPSILRDAAGLGLRLAGEARMLDPYHWGLRLLKGDADADRDNPRDQRA